MVGNGIDKARLDAVFGLAGKTCLVTGGSRGIGLGIARALGAAGATVIITARKALELDAALIELRAADINAFSYQHDLADIETSRPLVARIKDEIGEIDVLVNNAGVTWGAPAAEMDWANWRKVMQVNLDGVWALTQAVAADSMIPRQTGSIIMVASVAGLRANAPAGNRTVGYNTSKAGQINLARTLAAEWGQYGVRVNALLPGAFATKMMKDVLATRRAEIESRISLQRVGDPERDIGFTVVFLVSDAARYITGHALVVDGGVSSIV